HNDNYRSVVDRVYTAAQDGDVIVTTHPFEYAGVNYYLAKHSLRALTVIDIDLSAAYLPSASATRLPPGTDRFWLVLGKEGEFMAQSQMSAELASYRLIRRYEEGFVAAELYQATPERP